MKILLSYGIAGIVIGFCFGYTMPDIYYLELKDKIDKK